MFSIAWLMLFFPALGALINMLYGHKMSRQQIANVAVGAVAAAFLVAVGLFFALLGLEGEERVVTVHLWDWITIGDFYAPASMLIDPLSVTMSLIITGVGSLIHIYSIGYMDHEERFQRFFVYLNFFIFAMLILVLSNNLLGMFVGWEGVGLASFLLIGFYFEKEDDVYGSYADCGKKAFLVNRIGDFGMILAIAAVWTTVGTITFTEVTEAFGHGGDASLVFAANLICFLLLLGAAGKSAQIPLYVWLPDAMAGPTPVSALIHAATMVTAGIYMIARTHAIWHIAANASMVAAWVGGLTALLAATIAVTQNDLKKILAYSTVSQLGFMMMGVGVGAYGAAVFHLTTHAFFKACLFLSAGSVMHAIHDLDIRKMGGLRHKMPATATTFTIGAIALAGLPPLSGFFSKDAIKLGVLSESPALYVIALIAAFLTAFYTFRAVILAFYGTPRDADIYEHAHENPASMTTPLWILAGLATVAGFLNLPFVLSMDTWLEPSIGHHGAHSLTLEFFTIIVSILIAVVGTLVAIARYSSGESWPNRMIEAVMPLRPYAKGKWFVDEFYMRYVIAPIRRFSEWLAGTVDQGGIDFAVNWIGRSSLLMGESARRMQNGVVPTYALSILFGVVAVIAYFMLAA